MEQRTFFGENEKLRKLSKMGDPLEQLNRYIDWRIFEATLTEILYKENGNLGGRPAYDYVLMFKIAILQQIYNLSDDACEYQINDRISFQRFLGLSIDSTIPDAKTIWAFKEKMSKAEKGKEVFEVFAKQLKMAGVITHKGSIVDASFVEVPRQHKEDKQDKDASWTKKRDEYHYGYKNNVKVDADSKLISKYSVCPANVADNKAIPALVDKDDEKLYGDKAYVGKNIESAIKEINPRIKIRILKKAFRNRPLSEKDKKLNTLKSKIRSKVEHVFGQMKQSMNGLEIRCKGISRATTSVMLKNLTYNLKRFAYLRHKRMVSA